jgi:hypothetical protein
LLRIPIRGWKLHMASLHWRLFTGVSSLASLHWRLFTGVSSLASLHWRLFTGVSQTHMYYACLSMQTTTTTTTTTTATTTMGAFSSNLQSMITPCWPETELKAIAEALDWSAFDHSSERTVFWANSSIEHLVVLKNLITIQTHVSKSSIQ